MVRERRSPGNMLRWRLPERAQPANVASVISPRRCNSWIILDFVIATHLGSSHSKVLRPWDMLDSQH